MVASRRRLRECQAVAMGQRGAANGPGATDTPGVGAAVAIGLLGGFSVAVGGREIADDAWRLLKARALIKLLALAPRHRLPREQVMDALWPDADAEAARRNFAYALHVARRALDRDANGDATRPSILLLEGGVLSLVAPVGLRVDVADFAAAAEAALAGDDPAAYRAALALYSGELLPDEPYEDWLAGPRERLGALTRALRHGVARHYEAVAATQEAIATLAVALSAEPTDEATHVALMRLYARSGQRAQALAQFRALRDALRRELDTDPDAESQQLYAAILAGRFSAERDPSPVASPVSRSVQHNLPAPTTTLIGREEAVAAIRRALGAARLVTLTGAGGVGKTRLALAVGWALVEGADELAGGIWLLDLATLGDGALLPVQLAAALGLRERAAEPLLETVAAALRDVPALVILDNCEHLIDLCAAFAGALLARCPRLRLLATSREALRASGEVVWRVPSLALPEPPGEGDEAGALALLAANPAVQLFVERARLIAPDFALTSANAAAMAAICRHLDGIPLAIELAAARIAALSPQHLAARLDDALRLLTIGPRTAPQRHQTLRATLEWSHRLLTPDERLLLAQVAVFAGGWTLAAAETVCTLGDATLDLLAALVDKSLVQVEQDSGDELRYRLLETVRQFATERLVALGDEEGCRARHAAYFLALTEAAVPQLSGVIQLHWRVRLGRDLGNLRAALAWYAARDRAEEGLRLASALQRIWAQRDLHREGLTWLEAGLARATGVVAPRVRARALFAVAALEYQRDGDKATARAEASLALYRDLGDRSGQAAVCNLLGVLAVEHGDEHQARAWYEETLALSRASDDPWATVVASGNLCILLFEQGDYAAAVAAYEEVVPVARSLGDPLVAGVFLGNLGVGYAWLGRFAETIAPLRESLPLLAMVQDWPHLQLILNGVALLAAGRGDAAQAAEALGASAKLRAAGAVAAQAIQERFEGRAAAAARATLGETGFAAAFATGQARSADEIVAHALAYLADEASLDSP